MEKIGEGYYYHVYALEEDRVLKRQTGPLSKLRKRADWFNLDARQVLGEALGLRARREASIGQSRRLASIPELREALGNPRFVNRWEYEQDRAVPLQHLQWSAPRDEFLGYVSEYAELNRRLWDFGYADNVFNFTLNSGVSKRTGKVILIDFNESTESLKEAAEDIRDERWLSQYSLRSLSEQDPSLGARAAALLKDAFSVQELERRWRSACGPEPATKGTPGPSA